MPRDLEPIPPDAYERLAALREAAQRVAAAKAAGDEQAQENALHACTIHWQELVRTHHPEILCRPVTLSSGSSVTVPGGVGALAGWLRGTRG